MSHISLHPRLTSLTGTNGLYNWLKLFVRPFFLGTFNDEEAESIMNEVVKICEVDCRDASGNWAVMYVRLRFAAVLDI